MFVFTKASLWRSAQPISLTQGAWIENLLLSSAHEDKKTQDPEVDPLDGEGLGHLPVGSL